LKTTLLRKSTDLSRSHHNGSLNGNEINPAYLSKTGAFNGTGLAIASYSFGSGGYGVINVYFQHWTGQIRKMQLMQDGTWQGGDASNIVATDARNATPISAVAYSMDHTSTVRLRVHDLTQLWLTSSSGTSSTSTRITSSGRRLTITRRTSGETARSEN
jgi:hypothetical protein